MLPYIKSTTYKESKYVDTKIVDSDYLLQFDGCSKGNPGVAGAGAVIYYLGKEHWSAASFVGDSFTNNYAEYCGLIVGLKSAIRMGIKRLKVEGDSMLVINHMKGVYKCKSDNLLKLYDEAKELERQFDEITYAHIYRTNNKRADELSNIAIEV